MTTYRSLIRILPILLIALAATKSHAQKPNIVLIMADDIGPGDIGFYHRLRTNKRPVVPTPNIDSLISTGMRFDDAHSPQALCAPSRFSMLTGNYSFRSVNPYGNFQFHGSSGITNQNTTCGRIAKSAGYRTAFFGKWGVGGDWAAARNADFTTMDTGANSHGFDFAFQLPSGIQATPFALYRNRNLAKTSPSSTIALLPSSQTKSKSGRGDSNWQPDRVGPRLASQAVKYIKDSGADPFFMYYCSQSVHIPHVPPKTFRGTKVRGTTPGPHGDMIKELDLTVKAIVDALRQAGKLRNTLICFTSDNGGLSKKTSGQAMARAGHDSSNGLKGSKGLISEGGHRVPFICAWPGRISANSVSNEPVVAHDIVATISAVVGKRLDTSKVLDSLNLLPLLTGRGNASHSVLLHQGSGTSRDVAVREGPWKLIMKLESRDKVGSLPVTALYNLQADPKERRNLANNASQRNRIASMKQKYRSIRVGGASAR